MNTQPQETPTSVNWETLPFSFIKNAVLEGHQPESCPKCAARRRRQKAWFDAGWIVLALIGFGFSIPYILLFVSGGYSSLNF